ncbi:MAG: hypothetical protein ABL984_07715 [Pyrinomonadaceae bacterium]
MKNALDILGIIASVAILCVLAAIAYFYLTNRTMDQTLAENLPVSTTSTEIVAEPPLTAFRRSQELLISIPNYALDRGEKLPRGQIHLPDGRIASPEVEGTDKDGSPVRFHFRGHTLSERDYIVFTPVEDLDRKEVTKIRISSNESFTAEKIFWRNRNPK